ncbi:MAG: DUF1302 domain-containing protein [Rhodocyclaceae bacterium]|nr:DUF1302 domain-containing protein [Rhodocyclaceae bacterium]
MRGLHTKKGTQAMKVVAVAVAAVCTAGTANAFKLETSPEWSINFDNSIMYNTGWRMQDRIPGIANHFAYQSGDAKFDKGEMVTNRISDVMEFQAIYKGNMGFRTSASIWKDFAYNDHAKGVAPRNMTAVFPGVPAFPVPGASSYTGGKYNNFTKRYFIEGAEFLDAFVFLNTDVAGTPVYLKGGRFTQYWGNAFFFGFSNIAYSQHPIDYIKGFSQPGSEIKELFLPRKQILVATDLSSELSVAAQYFFEYRANRYPESGTYLGFFDPLFDGPDNFFAAPGSHGIVKPENNNNNWGLKVSWSPEWVGGDLGFYYRQFDEVDPWLAQISIADGRLQNPVNQKAKLFGISYERTFGLISTGFELSQRRHTALNSTPFNGLATGGEAAKGKITNFIANTFVQLGTTSLWDSGILLAELSYTRLNEVTDNESMYFGEGHSACTGGNNWRDGCSTRQSLAFAMLFDPQWLQALPGIDFDAPISYTWGAKGNPAYRASGFYGEGTSIYSVGIKATYQSKHSLALQYNGYHWRTNTQRGGVYAGNNGFGGIGAVGINDRGWLQLTFKTSF